MQNPRWKPNGIINVVCFKALVVYWRLKNRKIKMPSIDVIEKELMIKRQQEKEFHEDLLITMEKFIDNL